MTGKLFENYRPLPIAMKKGYAMTPSEKEFYSYRNSLDRKKEGRVDLYFKAAGAYPARIYLFMHAEMWPDRNRRPMGLAFSHPFLSRPMSKEEIEYHHYDTRLRYYQYENWDKLLFSEQCECDFLDVQSIWIGTRYMHKLKSYINKFKIGK